MLIRTTTQNSPPSSVSHRHRPPPPGGICSSQVGCCRGNKEKAGHHHRQDEEEEEAVIASANTAVEEKAVVVVVLDAQAAEFAVFCAVRKKQLWVKVWGWGLNSVSTHPSSKMNHHCAGFTRKGTAHAILTQWKTPKNASDAILVSYFTVGTEPVRTLVLLHQVGHAGEPGICVHSFQLSWVMSQNLAEQAKDEKGVDHWHLDQRQGWPHTFKG